MKEDVTVALKIALQHGDSLEKVVQSFINAGYSPHDIHEAAERIGPSAVAIVQPMLSAKENESSQPAPNVKLPSPKPENSPSGPSSAGISGSVSAMPSQQSPAPAVVHIVQSSPEDKKSKTLIITLIIILIVLVASLIFTLIAAPGLAARFFG